MYQLREAASEEEVMQFLRQLLKDKPELFTQRMDDHGCFMRALRRGDPTFTLVGRDITAPFSVKHWIQINPQLSPERAKQAADIASAMEDWPHKKKAD